MDEGRRCEEVGGLSNIPQIRLSSVEQAARRC